MEQTMQVVARQEPQQLAITDLVQQQRLVQSALKEVMVAGHHYGEIPGTAGEDGKAKPVLFKSGAEKLCALFRLAPQFAVQTQDLPNGHREHRVTCTLTHMPTDTVVAMAMGSCSTMESKYRYRNGRRRCPSCHAEAITKSKQDPGWFCWAKKGGCGRTFKVNDVAITGQKLGKVENEDIADLYNTVLKMAQKRSHMAATLLATAASDIFAPSDDDEAPPKKPDDEDDGDDQQEPPPKQQRQQQQQKAKAEPVQLTPKQELCRDCAKMASDLGLDREALAEMVKAMGIEPPTKWADLGEQDLVRVKQAMQAELEVRRGSTT